MTWPDSTDWIKLMSMTGLDQVSVSVSALVYVVYDYDNCLFSAFGLFTVSISVYNLLIGSISSHHWTYHLKYLYNTNTHYSITKPH